MTLVCDERGDGERHEQADVDIAVPVQADEKDRHGVEGDPDEQRSANGVPSRSDRDECQVQGDDEHRLGQHQVGPKRCPERDVDTTGDGVSEQDDLEPDARPVEDARRIRVLSLVLGLDRAPPGVDVQRVRVPDHEDDRHARKP